MAEKEEKWVTHYSSKHQILLVGEGDFSFSLCLALAFASASNIVSTSLDSYDAVTKKYKKAKSNLESLKRLGACLLHGVDATKMKLHPDLNMRKFDRIIFNFPHAGFYGKEDNALLIEMHRDLVRNFLRNSNRMLRAHGEVHISHKTSATFLRWNLEELGGQNSLVLFEKAPFNMEDYPGYNNKRGDGNRCDEPFPLGKCSTFKFRFSRAAKKISRRTNIADSTHSTPQATFQDNPIPVDHQPHSCGFLDNDWSCSLMPGGGLNSIHQMSHHQPPSSLCVPNVNYFPEYRWSPYGIGSERAATTASQGYNKCVSAAAAAAATVAMCDRRREVGYGCYEHNMYRNDALELRWRDAAHHHHHRVDYSFHEELRPQHHYHHPSSSMNLNVHQEGRKCSWVITWL